MSGGPRPLRELLTRSVVLTVLAGTTCAVAAAATRGRPGLVSAAAACVLVLAFLLVGQLPVHQAGLGRRRTGAALLVVLYALRVLLCLAALRVVTATERPDLDREIHGLTTLACALAWTAGTLWTALRWRPVLVVPESTAPQ